MWWFLGFIRALIINLMLLITIIVVVVAISSVDVPQPEPVSNQALRVSLDGVLVEQTRFVSPIQEITDELIGRTPVYEIDLNRLVEAIDFASEDPEITGLVLDLGKAPPSGIAKLQVLGQALQRFSDNSGKPIVAYADFYDQHQYYLASFADTVYLNNQGAVLLRGFSYERLFFKDALDKLAIEPKVFRVGTHKSFVEPYIRNDMSPEARADVQRWVDLLWDEYQQDIASNREINAEQLSPEANVVLERLTQVDGDLAKYAERYGLVDQLVNRSQLLEELLNLFGEDPYGPSYAYIDYYDYLAHVVPEPKDAEDKIAVLIAQGPIVGGEGRDKVIAADTVLQQLQRVIDDEDVKALVLRIDSGGGSAFASELIRDKLAEVQDNGIAVVVSMGTVAASGGYWIASSADEIFAEPTTITGSIGIFGMFASLEQALQRVGIHSDGYSTSPLAQLSPFSELQPELEALIQLTIEKGYKDFLEIVAEGRDMSVEQVEQLAEGRIWTGREAQQNGLVDSLGNLNQAIARAAELQGLEGYKLKHLRPALSPQEQFLEQLFRASEPAWLPSSLSGLLEIGQSLEHELSTFDDPLGIYSYCALCINEL
ncbi:signal peptide peptidase SppA [Aliagarivorans taiwanensis]|uniref:signal peptide peptidase SppA n=1 Tax=Aliagarivorans taiwanensis TaxID=561966 RepID=UPI00068553A5|nr:signal peptide peptidase SppA [Aliagarivorans taiwanensis]